MSILALQWNGEGKIKKDGDSVPSSLNWAGDTIQDQWVSVIDNIDDDQAKKAFELLSSCALQKGLGPNNLALSPSDIILLETDYVSGPLFYQSFVIDWSSVNGKINLIFKWGNDFGED